MASKKTFPFSFWQLELYKNGKIEENRRGKDVGFSKFRCLGGEVNERGEIAVLWCVDRGKYSCHGLVAGLNPQYNLTLRLGLGQPAQRLQAPVHIVIITR